MGRRAHSASLRGASQGAALRRASHQNWSIGNQLVTISGQHAHSAPHSAVEWHWRTLLCCVRDYERLAE